MKVVIFAVAAILASAKASILLEPAQPKTYENFSVLRVEVHTREEFDLLYTMENLHFWNQGRVGGHADVMVSPELLQKVQKQLLSHNLKFSTMIENVGDLMRLEKVNAVFQVNLEEKLINRLFSRFLQLQRVIGWRNIP